MSSHSIDPSLREARPMAIRMEMPTFTYEVGKEGSLTEVIIRRDGEQCLRWLTCLPNEAELAAQVAKLIGRMQRQFMGEIRRSEYFLTSKQ